MKVLQILGTRGIPARHGGFETFAEHLALYLVKNGWHVMVYCQEDQGSKVYEDMWKGVRLVHVPVRRAGSMGTLIFDWKATLHAARTPGLIITLGYNTALFSAIYKLRRRINLMNMDGIEWQREKWSPFQRAWLFVNERLGSWFSDHLVADHPAIKQHLMRHTNENKITMIPYGSDRLDDVDPYPLRSYNITPNQYALLIARPEPENSILEIVSAFSQNRRGINLVVLGNYQLLKSNYHKKVIDSASGEVIFPGAIYEASVVTALRYYARLYIHGHRVGGTNPSLVEALGAGNPILAHDNQFNRWVAGSSAHYFNNEAECAKEFDDLLNDQDELDQMKKASINRHTDIFTWNKVLWQYETLLSNWAR